MHETPPKPSPWWKRTIYGLPVVVIGVLAVLLVAAVIIGVVNGGGSDDDVTTTEPPRQVELCDELAKPENARLHPSDWRRITDFTQRQLETYVAQRCPEQSFKVLDD